MARLGPCKRTYHSFHIGLMIERGFKGYKSKVLKSALVVTVAQWWKYIIISGIWKTRHTQIIVSELHISLWLSKSLNMTTWLTCQAFRQARERKEHLEIRLTAKMHKILGVRWKRTTIKHIFSTQCCHVFGIYMVPKRNGFYFPWTRRI